jgi:hypothetical protein
MVATVPEARSASKPAQLVNHLALHHGGRKLRGVAGIGVARRPAGRVPNPTTFPAWS